MDALGIRAMREPDLDAAMDVTNAAFSGPIEKTYGKKPEGPRFAPLMGRYRLALDPSGCHVAVAGGRVVGAIFSVLRGTLGWFGPLAVMPGEQGRGIAQGLVSECLRSADGRGARLMGLETLANSAQHIHLYQKLGFRPSWTGISYRREVRDARMPAGVDIDVSAPRLDYVFEGYDVSKDARATQSQKAGVTLGSGGGFAVCHVESTLWPDSDLVYVPLIAAPDRASFDRLVRAVEAIAARHGKKALATQVPGSARATQEALVEHGYRPGGAALRMKRGEGAGYDGGPFYYCDDWH